MDNDRQRITISDINKAKNCPEPLVCLTAYTTPTAQILDDDADLLLVGDSVGMVLYGMDTTLGVDMEMMIRHGQAVMRGSQKACVIVDMPYGSYEESPEHALKNALRLMQETGASGVKLEGGAPMEKTIRTLVKAGIPVMGHIGLLPQSVIKDGGYKVKGKSTQEEQHLREDAKAVQRAGAFAVVIEGTIEDVAAELTSSLHIPTIGIGASAKCDGQILVTEDMLGLTPNPAKFVKEYATLRSEIKRAAAAYARDVRSGAFPAREQTYTRTTPVKEAS